MLHSSYDPNAALPQQSRRTVSLTRVVATVLGLTLLFGGVPTVTPPADAAPAQANERDRREDVRRQRAAAAAELNALSATDAQLEAAVAELTQNVQAQEARVADARRITAEARERAERLSAEIADTESEVSELEEMVRSRAVNAYVGAGNANSADDALLGAEDPSDMDRRKALISAVHGSDADAIDQLGGARARLDRQQVEVAEAIELAESTEAETEDRLSELASARSEQQRMQANLEARITGFRSEVDSLAAEEAQLTALIAQHEAEVAARQAAARQAEADRQAATRQAAANAAAATPSTTTGGSSSPSPSSPSPSPSPTTGESTDASVERPVSGGGLIWPASGSFTSGFGQRWGRLHAGIDIAGPTGTPISAAAGGTVITASYQGGYGNLVLIDHGNGMVTAYAHLSRFATGGGASVSQGQLIGYMGNTGNSTGPHLHFETRVNGSPRDPMNYLR